MIKRILCLFTLCVVGLSVASAQEPTYLWTPDVVVTSVDTDGTNTFRVSGLADSFVCGANTIFQLDANSDHLAFLKATAEYSKNEAKTVKVFVAASGCIATVRQIIPGS